MTTSPTPQIKFSEEARRFLLAATYGRDLPPAADESQILFVLWTLSATRIATDGSPVEESGSQYRLFAGRLTDVTSELLGELGTGKLIALRLDPSIRKAASYLVSLDGNRLSIQPG